jgi:hypothetical protein
LPNRGYVKLVVAAAAKQYSTEVKPQQVRDLFRGRSVSDPVKLTIIKSAKFAAKKLKQKEQKLKRLITAA